MNLRGVIMKKVIIAILFACGLTGCGHVMSEANLKDVDQALKFQEISAKPETAIGKKVLIGGIVEKVSTSGDISTIEVNQHELYENGVPNEFTRSGGRFLAITQQFIDPVVYYKGALVTIIGELKGKRVMPLAGKDFEYPLISIKEIRFFRESKNYRDETPNPYQNSVGDDKFLLRPR